MGGTTSYYFRGSTGVDTPLDIFGANLIGWWNMDRSTVLSDVNGISSISDLSASALNFIQSVNSEKPALLTGQLNGKPAASFNGIDEFMTAGAATDFLEMVRGLDFGIWLIAKHPDANPGNAEEWLSTRNISGSRTGMGVQFNDSGANNDLVLYITNNMNSNIILANGGNNSFPVQTWDYIQITNDFGIVGDDTDLNVGGASVASDDPTGSYGTGSNNGPLTLGSSASQGRFGKLHFAELIIVDKFPAAGEVSGIETYLTDEWVSI